MNYPTTAHTSAEGATCRTGLGDLASTEPNGCLELVACFRERARPPALTGQSLVRLAEAPRPRHQTFSARNLQGATSVRVAPCAIYLDSAEDMPAFIQALRNNPPMVIQ
jgi:hypothetical protein